MMQSALSDFWLYTVWMHDIQKIDSPNDSWNFFSKINHNDLANSQTQEKLISFELSQ